MSAWYRKAEKLKQEAHRQPGEEGEGGYQAGYHSGLSKGMQVALIQCACDMEGLIKLFGEE